MFCWESFCQLGGADLTAAAGRFRRGFFSAALAQELPFFISEPYFCLPMLAPPFVRRTNQQDFISGTLSLASECLLQSRAFFAAIVAIHTFAFFGNLQSFFPERKNASIKKHSLLGGYRRRFLFALQIVLSRPKCRRVVGEKVCIFRKRADLT
jgi:hypothetical protein